MVKAATKESGSSSVGLVIAGLALAAAVLYGARLSPEASEPSAPPPATVIPPPPTGVDPAIAAATAAAASRKEAERRSAAASAAQSARQSARAAASAPAQEKRVHPRRAALSGGGAVVRAAQPTHGKRDISLQYELGGVNSQRRCPFPCLSALPPSLRSTYRSK